MKKVYFLIGASGSGKTTASKALELTNINMKFCYFDSIGVPSHKDIVHEYGSGEEWQKAKTIEWVNKIKINYLQDNSVLLDAQTRPSFIDIACKKNNILNYKIILFDCTDNVRKERLLSRGNPELINKDMMNWAKFLKKETQKTGGLIVDTSKIAIMDMSNILKENLK